MPIFRQLTCALGDHIGGKDKGIEEEEKKRLTLIKVQYLALRPVEPH